MKRILVSLLLVLVIVSILAAACSTPTTPAPAPTTTAPAPAPTTAAPVPGTTTAAPTATAKPTASPTAPAPTTPTKQITLSFSDFGQPRGQSKIYEWVADQMDKQTNGQVKIQITYGATLGPAAENLDGLRLKVFDMALYAPAYAPGKTPLLSVGMQPLLTGDVVAAGKGYIDYLKLPDVQKEQDQWNIITLFPTALPTYNLLGRRPIQKVEDYKGAKITALSGFAKLMAAMGGEVSSMPVMDAFSAMEKGIIDFGSYSLYTYVAYGMHKLPGMKYISLVNHGVLVSFVGINRDVFNSLPQNARDILMKLSAESAVKNAEFHQVEEDRAVAEYKATGVQFYEMLPGEHSRQVQIAQEKVWPEWIADINKRGIDGQKYLDSLRAYFKKYESS
ncbi:MAG: TRAP transporter substrate-binding protein DctP [Chloroflexi bacterium]|nr:TRAP transporter substrate-binding protein DctP [Chloroflexota bacterium]